MTPKSTRRYRLRVECHQCPDCTADVYDHVFCARCRKRRAARAAELKQQRQEQA